MTVATTKRWTRLASRSALAALGVAALVSAACAPAAPAQMVAREPASGTVAQTAPKPPAPAATSAPAGAPKPATSAPAAKPALSPNEAAADSAQRSAGAAGAPANALQPAPPRPAPTPGGGTAQNTPNLPVVQNLGRRIIYTTSITILAEQLDGVPNQVATMALANGGYVAGIETRDENGVPTTIVTVKVPPAQYEALMRGVRGLAVEVREEKATTQDVTEEYDDAQTQIASLEAAHAQLLELMQRAGSVEELLKVQQQAAQVKVQIDRLKGRATALERLSDMATITLKAQLASVALQRDYTAVRASLRRAEATRASLEVQLKRARTPEEEAALRDRLGEAILQIAQLQQRVADLEAKAAAAKVTLPTSDETTASARADESLPQDYINTRVELRRQRSEQARLTGLLARGQGSQEDKDALTQVILAISRLEGQLRVIQERANQLSVTLPQLTDEQEAALAGVAPGQTRPAFEVPPQIARAWEASLTFLLGVTSALVFLWWAIPLAVMALVLLRRSGGLRVPRRNQPPLAPQPPAA